MGRGLSDAGFEKLRQFVFDKLGISIDERKRETVEIRIAKLARAGGMDSDEDYVRALLAAGDGARLHEFYSAITTNTTDFFREEKHFTYLTENTARIMEANPRIRANGEIRVWSAPCSSGEEAVTLAIVLQECMPAGVSIKILATDISEKALSKAIAGTYSANDCRGLSKEKLDRYFAKAGEDAYKVKSEISSLITYRLFNLTDSFIFKKGFDIIFCRNLMIYMENAAQQKLIDKFYDQLVPGGLFFTGHSESLHNKAHKFKSLGTSIYIK